MESYNTFLIQRGVVRNTISFYMRIFRSVYNKAVTQKIVEQTFPFKNVYTGVDKTRKRAVTETVISQLLSIDLKNPRLYNLHEICSFSVFILVEWLL